MPLRRVPFQREACQRLDRRDRIWVGEVIAKPISRMALSAAGLEPSKVAAIVVVSDELLNATQGEAGNSKRSCAALFSDALDLAFLVDDAATASTPAGILERRQRHEWRRRCTRQRLARCSMTSHGDHRRAVFIARPQSSSMPSSSATIRGCRTAQRFLDERAGACHLRSRRLTR